MVGWSVSLCLACLGSAIIWLIVFAIHRAGRRSWRSFCKLWWRSLIVSLLASVVIACGFVGMIFFETGYNVANAVTVFAYAIVAGITGSGYVGYFALCLRRWPYSVED